MATKHEATKKAEKTSTKPASSAENGKWMGIEPTWLLFRGHTGFEAQGGHQIRVHSPMMTHRLCNRRQPLSIVGNQCPTL